MLREKLGSVTLTALYIPTFDEGRLPAVFKDPGDNLPKDWPH